MLETNFLTMALPEDLKALLSACPAWEVPADRDTILPLLDRYAKLAEAVR